MRSKTIQELEFHIDQKENEIVVSVHKKLKKDDDKKVIKFLKNTFL